MFGFLVALSLAASCGKDAAAPDTTPASVMLSPTGAITLQSGATQNVVATVRNKGGDVLTGVTLTWSSNAPTVAGVTQTGAVTGAVVGTANVTAAAGSITSAPLIVTVTPGAAKILVMKTQPGGAISGANLSPQPEVELRDAAGNMTTSTATVTLSIASGGGTLTGTTSTPAVAGVASFAGVRLRGLPGNRTLTFSASGMTSVTSAAFALAVDPVATAVSIDQDSPSSVFIGATLQLSATATNQDGATVTPTFSWDSRDLGIATVDADGLVSGVAAGTTKIVAKANGITSDSLTVNVTDGSVPVRIEFGADARIINMGIAGSTIAPTLTAFDAQDGELVGVTFTFASRNAAIADIDADGLITAMGPGSVFVVATADGGARDSVYVQVLPQDGPVLYADLDKMVWHAGETVSLKVKLDMRGATMGAATFSVLWPDDFWTGVLNYVGTADGASALGTISQLAANGQVRATAASAMGVTGVVDLLQVNFQVRSGVAPRVGFITLLPQDVEGLPLQSLTSSVTALRYPIVVVP